MASRSSASLRSAISTYEALRHPAVNEITTDFVDPLPLVSQVRIAPTSASLRAAAAAAFPNVRTRTYPIEATQMFDIVSSLVESQGWEVRTRRAPPTALDAGQINAIATTLFGWRDEVAVRVTGTPQGSTVDMRSVPLSGLNDFGANGSRVEDFLLALDARITVMLRNAPQAPATRRGAAGGRRLGPDREQPQSEQPAARADQVPVREVLDMRLERQARRGPQLDRKGRVDGALQAGEAGDAPAHRLDDLGVAHFAMRAKRPPVGGAIGDLAAMGRQVVPVVEPDHPVEGSEVIRHRAVRHGDEGRVPPHDVVAGQQPGAAGDAEGEMVGSSGRGWR